MMAEWRGFETPVWGASGREDALPARFESIFSLMPEVPHAGKNHGKPGIVGGPDDLIVAHRAPRLNNRRRACFGGRYEAVGKWKKRIRGNDRSFGESLGETGRLCGLSGLERGDSSGIDAAHLAS